MQVPNSPLISRLPKVGTTIFTVMSALAARHQAVNLGQGFPDFDCDPALIDAVARAMRDGCNQYPPMIGVAPLRQAIADKIERVHGRRYDPDSEITVTAGGTQAILTAILAIVHPGDEVIVLEPCYDSYAPNIAMAGGQLVAVPMTADFRVPWDRVAAAITRRTRAIIVNTPHNPSATVFDAADVAALAALVERHGLYVIADEVYEHMVFDGVPHRSMSTHPLLAERAFVISSFGKTLHVTGWKVGYCVAPAPLTVEFRKVHQYVVFTVNSPAQVGIADYLADPASYLGLAAFYQAKRDRFRAGLAGSRFRLLPCEGSYFQVVDYSAISTATELEFAQWLTEKIGVAAVPMSAFSSEPREARRVRFCFAKRDETLDLATGRLANC
ncbi:MAG: pyridoxal phosphate-dependent aminotransferase [Lautropia sp.]